MSSILSGRLDEIDAQVDKVQRLVEAGCKDDPDMAAGLATTEPMPAIQHKIDQFAASVEALDRDLKKIAAAA